ncbi:hypothetical protein MRY87_05700 [bacterium]|nr:hypothetical protein [bacterium]
MQKLAQRVAALSLLASAVPGQSSTVNPLDIATPPAPAKFDGWDRPPFPQGDDLLNRADGIQAEIQCKFPLLYERFKVAFEQMESPESHYRILEEQRERKPQFDLRDANCASDHNTGPIPRHSLFTDIDDQTGCSHNLGGIDRPDQEYGIGGRREKFDSEDRSSPEFGHCVGDGRTIDIDNDPHNPRQISAKGTFQDSSQNQEAKHWGNAAEIQKKLFLLSFSRRQDLRELGQQASELKTFILSDGQSDLSLPTPGTLGFSMVIDSWYAHEPSKPFSTTTLDGAIDTFEPTLSFIPSSTTVEALRVIDTYESELAAFLEWCEGLNEERLSRDLRLEINAAISLRKAQPYMNQDCGGNVCSPETDSPTFLGHETFPDTDRSGGSSGDSNPPTRGDSGTSQDRDSNPTSPPSNSTDTEAAVTIFGNDVEKGSQCSEIDAAFGACQPVVPQCFSSDQGFASDLENGSNPAGLAEEDTSKSSVEIIEQVKIDSSGLEASNSDGWVQKLQKACGWTKHPFPSHYASGDDTSMSPVEQIRHTVEHIKRATDVALDNAMSNREALYLLALPIDSSELMTVTHALVAIPKGSVTDEYYRHVNCAAVIGLSAIVGEYLNPFPTR